MFSLFICLVCLYVYIHILPHSSWIGQHIDVPSAVCNFYRLRIVCCSLFVCLFCLFVCFVCLFCLFVCLVVLFVCYNQLFHHHHSPLTAPICLTRFTLHCFLSLSPSVLFDYYSLCSIL
eukprot:GHVQ01042502.1.p1 GENE.GHVQ01042502.1~~GHVQ01042502.1.p1  ORF type:complete len:119 (-),score=14.40 GHVQ01042502.1:1156-1512(-)